MICFQFWVSLTSLSLKIKIINRINKLWFAFNFGYLWHRYHWQNVHRHLSICCDLLSILGIFDIAITKNMLNCAKLTVVICFQFWVSLTSLSLENSGACFCNSCDLLSILGIFDIAITHYGLWMQRIHVVICFQFWVSLTSLSLEQYAIAVKKRLWFAFNFGYLWHRYHSLWAMDAKNPCCDLLSILGIFDIAITICIGFKQKPRVVICFQFWVSLTSLSLGVVIRSRHLQLWFAFNFGYLWHRYH